jgi:hypothetical protein
MGLSFFHKFSVENDDEKRNYIVKVVKPQFAFCEAAEMAATEAIDVISRTRVPPPLCNFLAAGIVCVVLSPAIVAY